MRIFESKNAKQITINSRSYSCKESIDINENGDIIIDGVKQGSILTGAETICTDKDKRPYVVVQNLEVTMETANSVYSCGNVEIKGDCVRVNAEGDVSVGGSVTGEISCSGSVDVGENVQGDIRADYDINIEGNVTGDLSAESSITIEGNVTGDIDTQYDVEIKGNVTAKEITVSDNLDIGGNIISNSLSFDVGGDIRVEGRMIQNEG